MTPAELIKQAITRLEEIHGIRKAYPITIELTRILCEIQGQAIKEESKKEVAK